MTVVTTKGGEPVDVANIDIGSVLRKQDREITELKEKLATSKWVLKIFTRRIEKCPNCKHLVDKVNLEAFDPPPAVVENSTVGYKQWIKDSIALRNAAFLHVFGLSFIGAGVGSLVQLHWTGVLLGGIFGLPLAFWIREPRYRRAP